MTLTWITLAPLAGAILTGFFGKRLGERLVSLLACGSVAVSTVLAFYAFFVKAASACAIRTHIHGALLYVALCR